MSEQPLSATLSSSLKALAFDVFGTVVDWHGSIVREAQALRLAVDPSAFAEAWRAGYAPAMDEVRRGARPWATIDQLHREILERLLRDFGIALPPAQVDHLNRVWHRLQAWPDSVAGLQRLRTRFTLAPLSNGNLSLLTAMAKHAGLPWDCVLSAELFGHYKPDAEVYLGAARLLDVAPHQLLMVAAHPSDLYAAARAGLRTAYVPRPLEQGVGRPFTPADAAGFDLFAEDFADLARQLGT